MAFQYRNSSFVYQQAEEKMINIFFTVVIFALLNTGLVLVAEKWKILEWYELHKKPWMPYCLFCLFFWMALIELTIAYFYQSAFDLWSFIMIIPFSLCSAVLSRYFEQKQ